MLFSHPKDFTPVCTTELGYMANAKPEFDKRGVKIIGLSVDPTDKHEEWAKDIEETQGTAPNYPIIADSDYKVSKLYDMLPADVEGDPGDRTPADNQTVRNVFVIGPDKKVKLILVYPMTTGRNFDEVLRVIDSLQLTAKHKVATPANWKQGEDVIISGSVSDDEAKETFRRAGSRRSPTSGSCLSRSSELGEPFPEDVEGGGDRLSWIEAGRRRLSARQKDSRDHRQGSRRGIHVGSHLAPVLGLLQQLGREPDHRLGVSLVDQGGESSGVREDLEQRRAVEGGGDACADEAAPRRHARSRCGRGGGRRAGRARPRPGPGRGNGARRARSARPPCGGSSGRKSPS